MASFVHIPTNLVTAVTQTTYKMARNIDSWQRKMIIHMISNSQKS
jgi:hypothetical protein